MEDNKKELKKDEAAVPKEQTSQTENEAELTAGELDTISGGKITGMNKSTDVTFKRGAIGVPLNR